VSLSVIYDRGFFEAHVPWRQEYSLIAETIVRHLTFSSALDLGCGNGFLIARLALLGKIVDGVDGSSHSIELAAPEIATRIQIRDLTQPLWLRRRDIVLCSEVGEHLDPAHADMLVDNICVNARELVFFTAATPGQGGHAHINERPHEYWIDKFRSRCFSLDAATTDTIRRELSECITTLWWFTNNAMVFRAE
jgi:SAM-dependent methyltransferase